MWTQANILKFIEYLRCTPCLWDVTNTDYKIKNRKNDALANIAKTFQVTVTEIEKKMHSLKSQFRREYKKLQDSKKSGISLKKCSWFGYEPLLFLLQGTELRDSQSTDSIGIETEEDVSLSGCQNDTVANDPLVTSTPTIDALEEDNISIKSSDFRLPITQHTLPAKKLKKNEDTIEENAFQCMKTLTQIVSKRDNFSVYGEHVGNKLRSCGRTDFEVATAQNHIDNILFYLTMGKYAEQINKHNEMNSQCTAPLTVNASSPKSEYCCSHGPSSPSTSSTSPHQWRRSDIPNSVYSTNTNNSNEISPVTAAPTLVLRPLCNCQHFFY